MVPNFCPAFYDFVEKQEVVGSPQLVEAVFGRRVGSARTSSGARTR